jgi:hypothetical protein
MCTELGGDLEGSFVHFFLSVCHIIDAYSIAFMSSSLFECMWMLERSVEVPCRDQFDRGLIKGLEMFKASM